MLPLLDQQRRQLVQLPAAVLPPAMVNIVSQWDDKSQPRHDKGQPVGMT